MSNMTESNAAGSAQAGERGACIDPTHRQLSALQANQHARWPRGAPPRPRQAAVACEGIDSLRGHETGGLAVSKLCE